MLLKGGHLAINSLHAVRTLPRDPRKGQTWLPQTRWVPGIFPPDPTTSYADRAGRRLGWVVLGGGLRNGRDAWCAGSRAQPQLISRERPAATWLRGPSWQHWCPLEDARSLGKRWAGAGKQAARGKSSQLAPHSSRPSAPRIRLRGVQAVFSASIVL